MDRKRKSYGHSTSGTVGLEEFTTTIFFEWKLYDDPVRLRRSKEHEIKFKTQEKADPTLKLILAKHQSAMSQTSPILHYSLLFPTICISFSDEYALIFRVIKILEWPENEAKHFFFFNKELSQTSVFLGSVKKMKQICRLLKKFAPIDLSLITQSSQPKCFHIKTISLIKNHNFRKIVIITCFASGWHALRKTSWFVKRATKEQFRTKINIWEETIVKRIC